jgi:hypothetical protein
MYGWWDLGHMAVAQIAYEELTPEVRQKADACLKSVSADFPLTSDFVSCSTWADDISNAGIRAFFVWHGSARPYSLDGTLSPEKEAEIVKRFVGNDIVWAIEQCCATFRNPHATPWAKGFMLRMLIHIVGDIHQPMHCITLYSKEFPHGDVAGTRYMIAHQHDTLHDLFDAAFGPLENRANHPLTQEESLRLTLYTKSATSSFSRAVCDKNLHDHTTPDSWRQESFEIGRDFAYARCALGKKVSDDVLYQGKLICEERIALAGYRLADLLNDLLK